MMTRDDVKQHIKEAAEAKQIELYYAYRDALLAHDQAQRAVIDDLEQSNNILGESLSNALQRERWLAMEKEQQVKEIESLTNQFHENLERQAKRVGELEAENKTMREALQLLYDTQNGCPLPKYEADWNRAMELAARALREKVTGA